MKKLTILLAAFLFSFINANATHISGGNITYEYFGPDGANGYKYLIRVELFRDVTSDIKFDTRIKLGIHNNDAGKTLEQSHEVQILKEELVTLDLNGCQNQINNPAFKTYKGTYEQVVTLPASDKGYHITYIRCCRAHAANIPDGLNGEPNQGNTFHTFIPPTSIEDNSPRFNHIKPRALCKDISTEFDFSATDKDGDSLVYKLVLPYQGGDLSGGNATAHPNPADSLKYPIPTVSYNVGYFYSKIFGNNGTSVIDENTGVLSVFSEDQGSFIAAVEVRSYRDGKLLSSIRQDFIITSIICPGALNNNAVLYADKMTFDEVKLDWAHCLLNVKGFRLERASSINSNWETIAELSANSLNYVDTDVQERLTYYYRVIADSSDSFEYSNIVATYIRSRDFYLIPKSSSVVGIYWEDQLLKPDGHIIEKTKDTSIGWNMRANLSGDIHSYDDEGLQAGTKYYYRIKSYKGIDTATSYAESISTFKVGIKEVEKSTITFYPNPSNNEVNLKASEPLSGKLLIYSQAGQIVKQVELTNATELAINITDLSAGVYYFTTIANGVTYRDKIVKLP